MKLLITGATGKVGSNFLPAFLADRRFAGVKVAALCHNRALPDQDRVETIRGSLSSREDVERAMAGVTHVIHMAAVKESPDLVIDVAVKGMFHLMEAFRASPHAKQFVLVSGDCAVGHIFHDYAAPVTEESPRRAYKGCYALTKVIEEVMLEQYQIQYGIDGCCLRAPWIMEKDDFRYAMSFGPDQFGGPAWDELMAPEALSSARNGKSVPLMLDHEGKPLRRNFVHVSDLVSAILAVIDNPAARRQLFNIAMDEPVNYAEAARYLEASQGLRAIEIRTDFFSNWLDNAKARLRLGWRPSYDLKRLIDEAWTYARADSDPRKIWYPG
jgi:UDP-glucose 4-epimerase